MPSAISEGGLQEVVTAQPEAVACDSGDSSFWEWRVHQGYIAVLQGVACLRGYLMPHRQLS